MKSLNTKLSFQLSPVTRWILTILVVGIGVVLVVVFYAQEQARNTRLKDEVSTVQRLLISNSLKKADLEARLVQANLSLAEARTRFPSIWQSMDVQEALYKAAADAGVGIVNIDCSPPASERVGGQEFGVLKTNVSVIGGSDQVLRFAGVLGYWLPSSTMETVSMGREGEEISLVLTIKVYTTEVAAKK